MGTCKDQLKATTDSAKKLMEKIKSIPVRKKVPEAEEVALTSVDRMALLYEELNCLRDTKVKDLKTEKGREKYNTIQLERIENMIQLLERMIEKAEQYAAEE